MIPESKSNIWQDAIKEKIKESTSTQSQKTIIILGSQGTGKTSLIKTLRNDTINQNDIKPTCLVEYNFIRKSTFKKQLLHCYEIAGKTQSEIIPSLVNKDNFTSLIFVICVDLSKPGRIVQEVTEWMAVIKKQFSIALQQKIGIQEKYKEYQSILNQRLIDHEDRRIITPAIINIAIIGCKYDLYEKYDTENRKWLSRALRYLALVNHTSLYFSSSKMASIGAFIRSNFHQIQFNDKNKNITEQKDHLKPIYIACGYDTVNAMGIPSSGTLSALDILKRQISSLFSVEEEKKKEGVEIAKYMESKIENLIEEKRKEMNKISKGLRNSQLYSKRVYE